MCCTVSLSRPTAGLPPGVLTLSGVLFSQSLMRPATPVFITAASCLKRGQKSAEVVPFRQMGPHKKWLLSFSLLQSLNTFPDPPTSPCLPWTCPRRFQAKWTRCLSPTCSWCFVCCLWPSADPPLQSGGTGTPWSLSGETKCWFNTLTGACY